MKSLLGALSIQNAACPSRAHQDTMSYLDYGGFDFHFYADAQTSLPTSSALRGAFLPSPVCGARSPCRLTSQQLHHPLCLSQGR